MIFTIISILVLLGLDISSVLLVYHLYIVYSCSKDENKLHYYKGKVNKLIQTKSPEKLLASLCFFNIAWIVLMIVLYHLFQDPTYAEANDVYLLIAAFVLNLNGWTAISTDVLGAIAYLYHLKKFKRCQAQENAEA